MTFHPKLWFAERQLAAKSPETRLQVVQKLRRQGDVAARDLFVKALQDTDRKVRAEAAAALGELKDSENLPPLTQALWDPAEEVQEAAVQALKRIGDREAVGALLEALNRGSTNVQWGAAQALKALGWQPGTPTEDLQFCIATGDLQRAASFGPAAVAPLTKVLREGSYQQRVLAANVLGEMASLAVLKPLLAALKDGDSVVRTAAAEALSRQQGPEAVAGLASALKDREPKVRIAAAAALGRLGNEEAVSPLIGALNDREWQVRAEALESLGRLGQRQALEAVTARLNDPDVEVRQRAADAVARLGNEDSIAKLLPNLVDVDAGVRQATLRSLNTLSPNWERASCVQAMVSKLQAATRHEDSGVQYAAVTLLKRITGLTVSELAQATERTKAERHQQLRVTILSDLLGDRDALVRLAAAEMVGRLRLGHCAEALRRGLKDADPWVQAAVREALGRLPDSRPLAPT